MSDVAEHISFDTLRSIVGDALHATAHGSGSRVVWPARYASHVDLLLRILAQKDATLAALREALLKLCAELSEVALFAVRSHMGNTNAAVLALRVDEARALLAPAPREA